METINEKVMRAWLQKRRAEVWFIGGGIERGKIITVQPADNSFKLIQESDSEKHGYYFKDINDIKFPSDGPDAVEFPAESYDVEILWECSEKAMDLRKRMRKGELILINDETGAWKIVSVAQSDPPDVAKERWEEDEERSHPESYFCDDDIDVKDQEWYMLDGGDAVYPYVRTVGGQALQIMFGAGITKAQKDAVVAAPQMLAGLEMVDVWLEAHHVLLDNQSLPNRIRKIIKKARGEDG